MPTSETEFVAWTDGQAGRIRLTRPKALNALTAGMVDGIHRTLTGWARDDRIALVLLDAEGERAFCAGGDLAGLYHANGPEPARAFWRAEYAMNRLLARFPKPVVSFLNGFVMGGGVGQGCHAACRIVCDSTRIALPECSVGIVPDVGSSALLAKAPGRLGEFLGLTGFRMTAADAIHAGFADCYLPESEWPALKTALGAMGSLDDLPAHDPGPSQLAEWQSDINTVFAGSTPTEIAENLAATPGAAADLARKLMTKGAPLAMASALKIIRQVREDPTIENALIHEYRFVHRAIAQPDFREGIRAAVIDKDRNPCWAQVDWTQVPVRDVEAMTAPLAGDILTFKGDH